MVIPPNLPALRWVSTAVDPNDKVEIYEELRATNREGVVFKEIDAPYSPGRPNSGGPQLKFKFVESASFVVTGSQRQTQRHARPLRWRQAGPRRQRHHPAEPCGSGQGRSVSSVSTSIASGKAARSTSRSISASAATSPPANAPSSSSNTRASRPKPPEPVSNPLSARTPPEASPVARHAQARPGQHRPPWSIPQAPWRPFPFPPPTHQPQ